MSPSTAKWRKGGARESSQGRSDRPTALRHPLVGRARRSSQEAWLVLRSDLTFKLLRYNLQTFCDFQSGQRKKIYYTFHRTTPVACDLPCNSRHHRSACCSEHEQKRQSARGWRLAASSQSMQPMHLFAHLIAPRAAIEIYRYRCAFASTATPTPSVYDACTHTSFTLSRLSFCTHTCHCGMLVRSPVGLGLGCPAKPALLRDSVKCSTSCVCMCGCSNQQSLTGLCLHRLAVTASVDHAPRNDGEARCGPLKAPLRHVNVRWTRQTFFRSHGFSSRSCIRAGTHCARALLRFGWHTVPVLYFASEWHTVPLLCFASDGAPCPCSASLRMAHRALALLRFGWRTVPLLCFASDGALCHCSASLRMAHWHTQSIVSASCGPGRSTHWLLWARQR